uniref:Uncharacterized protein n=1 Tax=Anguilla anguilla TaxID=7936 RepID=A0A0E9UIC6_ANGAN
MQLKHAADMTSFHYTTACSMEHSEHGHVSVKGSAN